MQTFKTAVVVVMLLAVLYGVYVVLNRPEVNSRPQLAWQQPEMGPLQIDSGTLYDPAGTSPAAAQSGTLSPVPPSALAPSTPPSLEIPATPTLPSSTVAAPLPTLTTPTVPQPKANYSGATGYPDSKAYTGAAPRDAADVSSTSFAANNPYLTKPNPTAASPSVAPPDTSGSSQQLGSRAFERAWRNMNALLEQREYREALRELTLFYESSDLTTQQHRQLLDVLDPLASKVIYSQEHLLEQSYLVRRGETLPEIADRYQVPWQLLKNINGVNDPTVLVPGTELKVVRGPFRAEVRVKQDGQGELTLFLNDLYAGRFPVTIGSDLPPQAGKFTVRHKQAGAEYVSRDRGSIPAGHPSNPYGQWFIDLGSEVSIHGSPTTGGAETSTLGCISLSPLDAADVYGILSQGSKVEIRR